jgi:hypothetical protein
VITFDPTAVEGQAIADLFRACKAIEDSTGGWNGGDDVEAACDTFQLLGIDVNGPAEQVDAQGTDTAPYPAGTEYPFSISDIARSAAVVLGDGWHAESGHWGVTGQLTAPGGAALTVGVDYEGDLYVEAKTSLGDAEYLPDVSAADGLADLAAAVAKAARTLI